MPVAFETHVTGVEPNGDDLNISVDPPTGLAAGNLWLVHLASDMDPTAIWNTPAGWTKIDGTLPDYGSADGGWQTEATFWIVAAGGETAVTFELASGTSFDRKYISVRLSGNHATVPIDAVLTTEYTGSGTAIDAPNVTVANNGSLAILLASNDGNGGVGFTPPSGTEIAEYPTGTGFPLGSMAYEAVNAGAYAPGNWTAPSDTGRRARTIIIAPAAGGGATQIAVPIGAAVFAGLAPIVTVFDPLANDARIVIRQS